MSGWWGKHKLHAESLEGIVIDTHCIFKVMRFRFCPLQVSGWQGAHKLHADSAGGKAVAYRGMVDCFVRTVKEEGPKALFKGLWPNYIKVVPSIALAFVSYEQVIVFCTSGASVSVPTGLLCSRGVCVRAPRGLGVCGGVRGTESSRSRLNVNARSRYQM